MFQKKTRLVEEDPEARLRPDANAPRSSQVLIINNTAFLAIGEGVPTVRQAAHRDRRPKYIGSAMIPINSTILCQTVSIAAAAATLTISIIHTLTFHSVDLADLVF